jgi:hypothetical protein
LERSGQQTMLLRYLTPAEIEKLIAVAKHGRYGQRDAALILVAYPTDSVLPL